MECVNLVFRESERFAQPHKGGDCSRLNVVHLAVDYRKVLSLTRRKGLGRLVAVRHNESARTAFPAREILFPVVGSARQKNLLILLCQVYAVLFYPFHNVIGESGSLFEIVGIVHAVFENLVPSLCGFVEFGEIGHYAVFLDRSDEQSRSVCGRSEICSLKYLNSVGLVTALFESVEDNLDGVGTPVSLNVLYGDDIRLDHSYEVSRGLSRSSVDVGLSPVGFRA